jgi:hypothetical protein
VWAVTEYAQSAKNQGIASKKSWHWPNLFGFESQLKNILLFWNERCIIKGGVFADFGKDIRGKNAPFVPGSTPP